MCTATSSSDSRRKSRRTKQTTSLYNYCVTYCLTPSFYTPSEGFNSSHRCGSIILGILYWWPLGAFFYHPYFAKSMDMADGYHGYRKTLPTIPRVCQSPGVNLVTHSPRSCTWPRVFKLQSYLHRASRDDTSSQSHDVIDWSRSLLCWPWNGTSSHRSFWSKYYRSICFL